MSTIPPSPRYQQPKHVDMSHQRLQLIVTKNLIQKIRKIELKLTGNKINIFVLMFVFFWRLLNISFKILVVESSSIATQVSPSATIVF